MCLTLCEAARLFSTVIMQFYISVDNLWELQFLYIIFFPELAFSSLTNLSLSARGIVVSYYGFIFLMISDIESLSCVYSSRLEAFDFSEIEFASVFSLSKML